MSTNKFLTSNGFVPKNPRHNNKSTVDGQVYQNRQTANTAFLLGMASMFSEISPAGLRKSLRKEPVQDAINGAKDVKRRWYSELSETNRTMLGQNLTAQGAFEILATAAANRKVGLDFIHGIYDLTVRDTLVTSALNSVNKVTDNKAQVKSISNDDIRATLKGLNPAACAQIVERDEIATMVRALCQTVNLNYNEAILAKTVGIPGLPTWNPASVQFDSGQDDNKQGHQAVGSNRETAIV